VSGIRPARERAVAAAVGPTRQPPGDPDRTEPFGGRLMTPLLLGAVLNPVNSTMIATALVAIGDAFGVGAADTAWLVGALYLASAVAQPAMGRLADLLGPRRVLLAGLLAVTAAGLVGTLAPAFGWVIAARVLLGVGTAAAYPCAMAVLRTRAHRLGTPLPRPVLARLSLAALCSAATGPVLGGLLVATVGWRGIFAVNVPVALLAGLLTLWWLPGDRSQCAQHATARPAGGFDVLGVTLFAATLTTVLLFLMRLQDPRWWLLPPFVLLGAALVGWELHRSAPFIDLRLLARHRPLVRTYVRHGLTYLVVYLVMYGYAQWLEEAHGLSSLHAGLVLLPMSIAAACCSLLGSRTRGIRGPLLLAGTLLFAGAGVLALAGGGTPLLALLAASVLFGLPQGLAGTNNQAAVATQAPADATGAAAGLQRTAQYLGALTAAGLIGLFYGQHADDAGLHDIALTTGLLGVLLIGLTAADRSLRGRS
jgi:MFS family permease